jgi:DnaJ-class molecular chaperone
MTDAITCPRCNGTRMLQVAGFPAGIERACPECGGSGVYRRPWHEVERNPAGVGYGAAGEPSTEAGRQLVQWSNERGYDLYWHVIAIETEAAREQRRRLRDQQLPTDNRAEGDIAAYTTADLADSSGEPE